MHELLENGIHPEILKVVLANQILHDARNLRAVESSLGVYLEQWGRY